MIDRVAQGRKIADQIMTVAQKSEHESIDFLIITPTNDEFEAVLLHLPQAEKLSATVDPWHYYRAVLPLAADSSAGAADHYRLIILPLRQEGNKRATSATKDAIHRFRPRCILLVGIAGGIAARGARLGDVLIADQILDYERQIVEENSTKSRPHTADVDRGLLYAAQGIKAAPWHQGSKVPRPAAEPAGPPQCLFGPMASGDKLIKDNEYLKRVLPQWSTLLGCEMEAAGVITAAAESEQRPRVLMIRAANDRADGHKLDPAVKAWRAYACDIAACFAVALLRSRPITTAQQIGPTPAEMEVAIDDYYQRLCRQFLYADHRGIEGANRVEHVARLALEELYVLPELLPEDGERTLLKKERDLEESLKDEDLSQVEKERLMDALDQVRAEHWRPYKGFLRPQPIPLTEVLQSYRLLVILGGPGSGKSTLLRYLTLQLARKRLPDTRAQDTRLDLVPLHLSLTSFANARLQEPGLSLVAYLVGLWHSTA